MPKLCSYSTISTRKSCFWTKIPNDFYCQIQPPFPYTHNWQICDSLNMNIKYSEPDEIGTLEAGLELHQIGAESARHSDQWFWGWHYCYYLRTRENTANTCFVDRNCVLQKGSSEVTAWGVHNMCTKDVIMYVWDKSIS